MAATNIQDVIVRPHTHNLLELAVQAGTMSSGECPDCEQAWCGGIKFYQEPLMDYV